MGQSISVSGALTGGSTGSLDSLYAGGKAGYYSALATGDIALVYYNDRFYVYRFYVAGSAQTESSPTIIKPDNQSSGSAYTGYGAWLLVDAMSADFLSPLRQAEISVTGAVTATIGRMHVCSGTSADYTVTLPAAADCTGKMIGFRMSSALTKLVTLDGNGSETIDGTATRIMWAGESAILLCNGTSWTKIAGKSIPMSGILSKSNGNLLFTVSTLTIIPFDTSDVSLAAMVTIGSYQLNIVRAGKYDIYGSINYSTNNSDNSLSSAVVGFNGVTGVMSNHSQLPGYNTSATQIKFGHSLNIGDYLTLHGRVTGTFTTSTINPNATPYLMIQEVPTW